MYYNVHILEITMDDVVTAYRLCAAVVKHRDIPNATARIATWLVGAAIAVGGFPLELSLRQIKEGFIRDGISVAGTGCRHETIKVAIDWLENQGYLRSVEGKSSGFGHNSRIYEFDFTGE